MDRPNPHKAPKTQFQTQTQTQELTGCRVGARHDYVITILLCLSVSFVGFISKKIRGNPRFPRNPCPILDIGIEFTPLSYIFLAMADYPKVYLYRRIVQAKLFIDAHYQQEIRLDQICDQAYFSKFYFIRLFKQIYRLTPNQYLQERRINRAKNLLKAGESVSQVCVAVGFNSISTFTGLFKRSIGQTPSQFKQQQEQLRLSALQTPLKFIPHCFASSHAEKSNFEEVASSTAI